MKIGQKILFIDRDGTICKEPADHQVDRLEKVELVEGVIPALLELQTAGYDLVMISNQDGLGTESFPQNDFETCQKFLLTLLVSQGVKFREVLICPHFDAEGCSCRKPKLGLVIPYLRDTNWDRSRSAVIGDRESDLNLAQNMGIAAIRVHSPFGDGLSWKEITDRLLRSGREATVVRESKETYVEAKINLDLSQPINVSTGLGFFDHMLEQIAKHAGLSLELTCRGDLNIDDHHSVEDVGLVLGEALKRALGDKRGLGRYGFSLPMDETEAKVLIDLGGRPYLRFEAQMHREKVGDLSTEMVPHFFRSLAESLGANIHIQAQGENDHHIVEGIFKAFARALKQAIRRESNYELPSTKGLL